MLDDIKKPSHKLAVAYPLLLLSLYLSNAAHAENTIEYELDPYYSNIGYYISFTDKEIPEVVNESESHIYQDMFDSFTTAPQFMVIEASINPLPIAGAYIKKNHRTVYDRAQTSADLNIIQAATEGFQEPYALSFFLGSVVRFIRPNESSKSQNKGYVGYLLSVGDKHITRNEIIDDDWYELEFKMKGDQDFEDKTLSWSFRVGTKVHSNSKISDVYHFGIRRNHFDASIENPGFLDNSDVEYKLEFDTDSSKLVQQEFFINKKWHLGFSEKSSFSFGIGFIVEKGKYSGSLASGSTDFSLIFRPNLSF